MKEKVINFLCCAFPFLFTIFLWRLATPWFNPAGILAIIPIFFCSFIRPVPWFIPFAILMCFCIDYRSDTVLYWTSVFCLCYAANGFQSAIDLTRADDDGLASFMLFFAAGVAIITVLHMTSFMNVLRAIWTVIWASALYIPCIRLIKAADHD